MKNNLNQVQNKLYMKTECLFYEIPSFGKYTNTSFSIVIDSNHGWM